MEGFSVFEFLRVKQHLCDRHNICIVHITFLGLKELYIIIPIKNNSMTPYLKAILLVDDDYATNHYHEIMLTEWGVAETIYKVSNGQEALDFLKDQTHDRPSLIMLDINMPVMNGFEFLLEYEKLEAHEKVSYVVFMLTSSLHNKDIERAKDFNTLQGYCEKPMTEEMMQEILKKIMSGAS